MGAMNGYGGNVTFATGYVTNVKSWSMDYTGETLDTTDFSSTGARSFIAGLTQWNGQYVCNLDDTTTLIAPGAAAAAGTFLADSNRKFSGSIIVTGLSFGAAADGLPEVTVSYQGTGALTIA